jgi:hypothetical protein
VTGSTAALVVLAVECPSQVRAPGVPVSNALAAAFSTASRIVGVSLVDRHVGPEPTSGPHRTSLHPVGRRQLLHSGGDAGGYRAAA